MLYINPEKSPSNLYRWPHSRLVSTAALSQEMPELIREWSSECAGFVGGLPLRYSGLPLRRRLTRMMLTFQKCCEAHVSLDSRERVVLPPAADYAQSVIDTAMLRGELRCRPSGVMTRTFLSQTEELMSIMAGVQGNKLLLRKEVRRRTTDFLLQFAVGSEA